MRRVPQDNDGNFVAEGDCYRGEMWVAEIYTIAFDTDYRTFRVSYGIMGTIAHGVCSLTEFLSRFPNRVELRPSDASQAKEAT